ncbi:hypothetical protein IFM89_016426 [Coptis chinensis]|uniref:Nuclear pore complex protein NUP214 n=1 Tax=Coptis chinensis TaxID=261450 RepID=A0A835HDV0_9MAGN|nr:hypothetical protein IFM89_016426 [Coptis chinensis]
MTETKEEEKSIIQLDEEVEGDLKELEDLFFKKIGHSIPLKPQPFSFDLQNPPTHPLAVSESPPVLFLAHSQGFYVVRTKDVIQGAKERKGCCIEEMSVVNVQIGRVNIVAVSRDCSTLAACVGAKIYFFEIESLLNKEQEPLYSCSIDESSYVRDFRWRKKKSKTSFVVLSRNGKLYHGDLDIPLKEVMDNVDAVDWSTEGNCIAVAKTNYLSIFSSRFRERFTLSIPLSSCVGDTDSKCTVKVDSINWVREDCIVLGCVLVTEDGKEDGYLIQIISSKDGKISEVSSKPVVLSFDRAFAAIDDDMMPFGSGPHLFMNYLEHSEAHICHFFLYSESGVPALKGFACHVLLSANQNSFRELALVANRKNRDQHIVLFGWSLDDEQDEAALVELVQEDRWLPRIGLQDDEEDNLVMGFGLDKVSLYEKVEVMIGVEHKELSPYCILLCLTLDGKLLMFYVAGFEEDREKGTVLYVKSPQKSQEELQTKGGGNILKESELQVTELNDFSKTSSHVDLSNKETGTNFSKLFGLAAENKGMLQPLSSKQESITFCDLAYTGPQSLISGRPSSGLQKSSEKLLLSEIDVFKDSSKLETQKTVFASPNVVGTNSLSENIPSTVQSSYKDSLGSDVFSNDFSRNLQRDGSQSASFGSQSSHKLSPSDAFKSRTASSEVNRVQHTGSRMGNTGQVTGSQSSSEIRYGNISNIKDPNAVLKFPVHTSGKSTHTEGQKYPVGAAKLELELGISSSQVSPYGDSASNILPKFKLQPSQENLKNSQSSRGTALERGLSKNFGNVNEMAKELDTLLADIEGDGGFRDACMLFQKDSVLGVEQDLENLADRGRVWKNKVEEQLEGVQHLLDQTIQVLARRIYMEGIVKQASDTQYWDLWNRQKLTPELELKRRQILKVNQDLTNQLVELERHFNTLELNRFSDSGGDSIGRRVLRGGSNPSRRTQAFSRLYNTMSSQLAAAEQLSECLTKQMSVLNIESPSAKRKLIAKELFDSIGLAYDGDSFKSPDVKKVVHSPESLNKVPFSSASSAIKEQSWRNPSSVVKSFEPETARRRVSLDRSWASFEPPKTTVKRMLLQEEHSKPTANKSPLMINKEGLKQSPSLHSYVNSNQSSRFQLQAEQDNLSKASKQNSPTSFKWSNNLSGTSQSLKSSVMQVTQRSNLPSSSLVLDSRSSPSEVQINKPGTFGLVSDRSTIGMGRANQLEYSQVQPISFSNATSKLPLESSSNQTSSTTIHVPSQILASPNESSVSKLSNVNHGDTAQAKAKSSSMNCPEVSQEDSVTVPVKSLNSQFSLFSSPAVSSHEKCSQPINNEAQPGVSLRKTSAPSNLSSSSSPMFSVKSEATINPSIDANKKFPSASSHSTSSHSTPSHVSPSPFSSQATNQQVHPSTNVKLEVQPTELKPVIPPMEPKPTISGLSTKFDVDTTSQPEPQSGKFNFSPETAVAPAPADVSTTIVATDRKNGSPDLTATQEDEMEEEASDPTANLSLGSLGGFELGAAPTSAAPKSNPFGLTFPNTAANPASSPFNLTVPSGELFRPASFSLQQPSQPANMSAFSSHFTVPEPTKSFFGQPAQIGPGQQALGSVLGAFGQSRQLGTSLPGTGFASASGFGSGGFANAGTPSGGANAGTPSGGFANAGTPSGGFANATTGGFAGVASTAGGFSGVASGAMGFAAAAASAGGFAGAAGGGSGFGGFTNQQGGGGFSGFGSNPAGTGQPPSQLFTQMRK